MASIRQILQRRRAVDSIARITRTLEMVSTARYKAYSNKRLAIVDYHDALATAAYLLTTPHHPIDHPLMKENSSGRMAIIAVGSRKGLCGSYNTHVYRLVEVHVRKAKALGKSLDIYMPHCKLEHSLAYHGLSPTRVYTDLDEVPTSAQVSRIADEFIDQYVSGRLDYLGIVHMRFHSASSQQAQTLAILPLANLVEDLTIRARVIWPWDLTFEDFYRSPSADKVIEALARMLMRYSIQSCFMDAALSEHLARMIAMRNATDNAEDMIQTLTTEYNRARQSQITGELLDIISGTRALQ